MTVVGGSISELIKLPLPDIHRELKPLKPEDEGKYHSYMTEPDSDGIQTIVEYGINQKGQKVKLTRRVRIRTEKVKINKRVEERRRTWGKFGDCLDTITNEQVTYTSPETTDDFNWTKNKSNDNENTYPLPHEPFKTTNNTNSDRDEGLIKGVPIVKCRNCGGTGHWSRNCPALTSRSNVQKPQFNPPQPLPQSQPTPQPTQTYKPPLPSDSESTTIHITNLSYDDFDDWDFQQLVRQFGFTTRINVPRNEESGRIYGYAYVNYTSHYDAQQAINGLNRKGYDNLLLNVDWAKRRPNR